MRRLIAFVLVMAGAVAAPPLADACSCVGMSPCQQFGRAGAVFAGEVVDVSPGRDGAPAQPKIVRVRVARAYKGATQVGQVVAVEMPPGSSASCSLDVDRGARLVVYGGVEGGRISTNLCRGSHALERDAPWPALPPQPGVVSGRLMRSPTPRSRTSEPVAGVAVSIDAAGRRIAVTTDADGRFRLENVPPGKWQVAFALGRDEQAAASVELQSAEDCAEVYVPVQPRRPAG